MEPNEKPAENVSASPAAAAVGDVLGRGLRRAIRWAAANPETVTALATGFALGVDVALTAARFYRLRGAARATAPAATVSGAQPGEVIIDADYRVKE